MAVNSVIVTELEPESFIATYVLEEDKDGKSVREFSAPGKSREEALSILTHTINSSKGLSPTEKEKMIETVRNEIGSSSVEEPTPNEELQEQAAEALDRMDIETEGSATAPATVESKDRRGKSTKNK